MDFGGARKFRISFRSLVLIIAVIALLLTSAIWNFALYRRAEEQRLRAIAAERAEAARAQEQRLKEIAAEQAQAARTQIEAEKAHALAKRKATSAEDAARVRQLYQELNALSQINDRLLMENHRQVLPAKKDNSLRPVSNP
jgi:cytoskeletal protein RodZ